MSGKVPQVLVTGCNGQLGRSLQALARTQDGVHYDFATRAQLDISQETSIGRWLDAHPADFLVNAAAYTAVDRAAQEPDRALAANAQAPGLLAAACAQRGVRFLHVSTDYVFDGRLDRPYRENDATAPLNTYGRSKLLGEQAALAADPTALILRTSWVFSAWEPNFVRTMLRLAQQRPALSVVGDQIGGPTWAGHIAQVLHALVRRDASSTPGGIYHFSGHPWVSWYEFAQEIFSQARACGLLAHVPTVTPIPSAQWPTPEPRPMNSRLDCSKLSALLGSVNCDWKQGLAEVLRTIRSET